MMSASMMILAGDALTTSDLADETEKAFKIRRLLSAYDLFCKGALKGHKECIEQVKDLQNQYPNIVNIARE